MKGIIMAGGKGTRLKPLTCSVPKPMVPVINKPTMEYTIDLLKKYDIKDVAITLAHLPNSIIDYFKEGENWGLHLKYYIEDSPLGTGGSVKNCSDFIQETFLVVSGDALTDLDIQKAVAFHKHKGSKATLVLKEVEIPLEYGVVITDNQGRITRFMEKPSWGEVFSNCINTGMYILEPEVLNYFNPGDIFDFSKDLFPKLLEDDIPMYGYITTDYWNDIGSMESYIETHEDILSGKVKVQIHYDELRKNIWVGKNSFISGDCILHPPVIIGDHCQVNEGSIIGPYTVLGNNSIINAHAAVKKSILWNNCYIDKEAQIKGAVICSENKIKKSVKIFENVAIGEQCLVENNVVIKPDVKIWPSKKIEENTIVTQNLVWGTKITKSLFGYKDISGHINVEISPEFATRLGAAFASIFPQDSTLVISSDDNNSSSLIKNCIISGILSVGCSVVELKDAILPMTSNAIIEFSGCAGVHIRKDLIDEDIIHLDFLNEKGMNIHRRMEREVENLFIREDFKRCNARGIKTTITIEHYINHYIEMGRKRIKNLISMKKSSYKVLFSSRSKLIRNSLAQLFNALGIEAIECVHDDYDEIVDKMDRLSLNMAIVIPEDGEGLALIDQRGRIIENEKYNALVLLMILKEGKAKKIVIPHVMPSSMEKMVDKFNIEIIRSKSMPSNIMEDMKSNSQDHWLNQYMLTYNPIWAVGMIIDFIFEYDISLDMLVDEIPDFYYIKNKLPCQLKDKGRVIREMFDHYQSEELEMFEGIKISNEKGWTIVIPDSEKPQFNLFTEGVTQEYAQELSTFYQDKIKEIMTKNSSKQ
ncbi:MAG: sugar phosphate nucleotidyltransferase [Eubacteriales bacterium]